MKLNEGKSGLVEFLRRSMKRNLKNKQFHGFPVCNEYKYLGLRLSNKLSMNSQLSYIKNKSVNIFQKLSPSLYGTDLDTKKSMWQI